VPLTDLAAQRIRPPAKGRAEIRDGKNLFLHVSAGGARRWVFRFKRFGKVARVSIGRLDALSVAQARQRAATLAAELAQGVDLLGRARTERRRAHDRLRAIERGDGTFPAELRQYIRAKGDARQWRDRAQMLGLRGDDIAVDSVADRWRRKLVADIGREDVRDVLLDTREYGTPGRKSKGQPVVRERAMQAALGSFFRWAIGQCLRNDNPAHGFQIEEAPERDRTLTDDEIRAVWRALDAIGPDPRAEAVRLMLLTGQRRNECGEMRWPEIQGDLWQIPKERMKGGRAHEVHLTEPALALLARLPRVADCPHVFTINGLVPVQSWSHIKKEIDRHALIAPWTLHDLRRTCATYLYESGRHAPHVIEQLLAHRHHKRGVAGKYNHAIYRPQVRAAAIDWAAHVIEKCR
jgi:integrase